MHLDFKMYLYALQTTASLDVSVSDDIVSGCFLLKKGAEEHFEWGDDWWGSISVFAEIVENENFFRKEGSSKKNMHWLFRTRECNKLAAEENSRKTRGKLSSRRNVRDTLNLERREILPQQTKLSIEKNVAKVSADEACE